MSNEPTGNDGLIRSTIKSRNITFYLASEQDLKAIKSKAIFGDLFVVLASIFIGAYVAYFIAEQPNNLILLAGVLFLLMGLVLYFLNNRAIKLIMTSGEVQHFAKASLSAKGGLLAKARQSSFTVIKAVYGTGTAEHELDITDRVQGRLRDDKLEVDATNELAGGDPHPMVKKTLTIVYSYGGVTLTKEFTEGQAVRLP